MATRNLRIEAQLQMFRWETHKEDGLLQREFLYSSLDDAGTKSDDTGLR